jgi:hypothetical protein
MGLFERLSLRILKSYRRRVVVEEAHELRRHGFLGVRRSVDGLFCRFRVSNTIQHLGTVVTHITNESVGRRHAHFV